MRRLLSTWHGRWLWSSACFVTRATLAAQEKIPPLEPPHGELPPSFWEQHGWTLAWAAIAAAAAIILFILWLRRPKPGVVTPPEIAARLALEALRGSAEDDQLLVKVSRILRRHTIFAFDLPSDELTTAELRQALASQSEVRPELIVAVTAFLQQCDARKFSPVPPSASVGAVGTALELFETIELHRKTASQTQPAGRPVESAATNPS